LLALLKAIDPTVEVIILTGQGTMEDAIEALREGRAFDFILKPVKNLRSLNEVIDRAIAKRRFAREVVIPPARPGSGKLLPVHIEALSAREREILAGLRSGLDNRLIADRLGVSEKTVKNSLTKVYEKLKVSNRTQAVLLAHQYDLI
jgi:DNA-binding NarL/FixJ family response regulator